MFLRDKSQPDSEPVHMDWDQAQAALRAGGYEIVTEGVMADESTRSAPIVANLPEAAEIAQDAVVVVPAAELPDLDAMTRAELDAHAEERGIDVSSARTKADVVEVIRTAPPIA